MAELRLVRPNATLVSTLRNLLSEEVCPNSSGDYFAGRLALPDSGMDLLGTTVKHLGHREENAFRP